MAKPDTKSENVRGIPEAAFVEDVDAYVAKEKGGATEILRRIEEQLSKYRFMETHLDATRKRLKCQIPDIKSCLQIISEMKDRQSSSDEMETRFLLSDQVYVKATVPPSNKVCLWLGANVMLEYELDAAEALLNKNLSNAETRLKQTLNDLDYLRAQLTTSEVTLARVHNWDVKRKRAVANKAAPVKK